MANRIKAVKNKILYKYIRSKYDNKIAYKTIGLSIYSLQDYQGAIEVMSKVIEINPKDEIAYEFRGNSK